MWPDALKETLNVAFGPVVYTVGVWLLFIVMIATYRIWTRPKVALGIFLAMAAFFVISAPDPNFQIIITKPDNVPIVALLFLLFFFVWVALRQAAVNDERIEKGMPPLEKTESEERILVWPDLVYTELICMVIATVVLVVWSLFLAAPLEEPANPARTPNPSKAPWYFLGLQEMLVYFDPWIAGVLLPSLIITGLIIVPYCDKNPKGAGYYTLKERPFAVITFLFGFSVLWVSLIIMGTFLRGPNWNFFGPFEFWDVHKLEPLVNVNLSEMFWVQMLGVKLPGDWWVREAPGILLLLGFFAGSPYLAAATFMRGMYKQMGFLRFSLMIAHLQWMVLMIVKMVLRWTINLKYIVFIPEHFFNV
jgi:hypothetical protein